MKFGDTSVLQFDNRTVFILSLITKFSRSLADVLPALVNHWKVDTTNKCWNITKLLSGFSLLVNPKASHSKFVVFSE